MTPVECLREQEVLSAVRVRGWRDVCNDELKKHVDGCEVCRDLIVVAELMRDDYVLGLPQPQLPAAGQVWWRAAVRARAEAAEAAARPLTWVHGIAGACVLGVSVAAVGVAWPAVAQSVERAVGLVSSVDSYAVEEMVSSVVRRSLPLLLGVGACLVLAPIALYFVVSDE